MTQQETVQTLASPEKQAAPAQAEVVTAQEMKVVVTMKGNRATIAVGAPDCDPRIELCEVQGNGDPLLGAIALIPEVVAAARLQWATAKRYPTHHAPPPPPIPAATARQARPAPVVKAKPQEVGKPVQPSLLGL